MGPLTLEAVLNAIFESMIRAWQLNRNSMLLVGRLHNEPKPEAGGFFQNLYKEMISRCIAAALRAAPEVSEDHLFFWIHFLFGAVVQSRLRK